MRKYWPSYGACYDSEDESIWFTDYWSNVLCEFSLSGNVFLKMIVIPNVSSKFTSLYSDVIKIGDQLLLSPCNADEVVVYCKNSGEFLTIKVEGKTSMFNHFGLLEKYKDRVYMFPYADNHIYVIDFLNNRCEQVGNSIIDYEIKEGDISLFQMQHCREDNIVFFISAISNTIFCFDMENETIEKICVGDTSDVFNTISSLSGGKYLLSLQNGNFYVVDIVGRKIIKSVEETSSDLVADNEDTRGPLYIDSVKCDNVIWHFPYQGKRITGVDVKSFEKKVIDLSNYKIEDYIEKWQVAGFSMVNRIKKGYTGFWNRKGSLFIIPESSDKLTFMNNSVDKEEITGDLRMLIEDKVIREQKRKFYTLVDFLRMQE